MILPTRIQSRRFVTSSTALLPRLLNITFNNHQPGKESTESEIQHHVLDLSKDHDFSQTTTSCTNITHYDSPKNKFHLDGPPSFELPRKARPISRNYIQQLADIVKRDCDAPPEDRIDLVRFSFCSGMDHPIPSTDTWRVLDGLRPRHLEIIPRIDLRRLLNGMHTPWPLETVLINGEDASWGNRTIPRAFSGLRDLTLDECPRLSLIAPTGGGGLVNLKNLKISGSDVMDSFVHISHANKALFHSVERLVLLSYCEEMDKYGHGGTLQDFGETLRKYTRLKTLEFRSCTEDIESGYRPTSDYFISLPSSLPPSLKHLWLTLPVTEAMIGEMNAWIQLAEDASWLPELTDLSFTLSTDDLWVLDDSWCISDQWCMDDLSKRPKQNLVEILERKGEEFLNIFRTSHPNVKVESSFK